VEVALAELVGVEQVDDREGAAVDQFDQQPQRPLVRDRGEHPPDRRRVAFHCPDCGFEAGDPLDLDFKSD
jgi:hypothetical protein